MARRRFPMPGVVTLETNGVAGPPIQGVLRTLDVPIAELRTHLRVSHGYLMPAKDWAEAVRMHGRDHRFGGTFKAHTHRRYPDWDRHRDDASVPIPPT
jgi:hypothetical protein